MSYREANASAGSSRPQVSLRDRWGVLLWIYENTSGLLSHIQVIGVTFFCLWSLIGEEELLPDYLALFSKIRLGCGGTIFSIFVGYAVAIPARQLAERLGLPGSIGMMFCCMVMHDYATMSTDLWDPNKDNLKSSYWIRAIYAIAKPNTLMVAKIHHIALATILLRAGLHIDTAVVRRVTGGVSRMPVIPCIIEAMLLIYTNAYTIAFGKPVFLDCDVEITRPIAAMVGFAFAASTSVVFVPTTMQLTVVGWSLDEVVVIFGFAVAYSYTEPDRPFDLTQGHWMNGSSAYVGENFHPFLFLSTLVCAAAIAICLGLIILFFPHPGMEQGMVLRCSCLFLAAVVIIRASFKRNVPYAGVLSCFLLSYTVQVGFQRGWTRRLMQIQDEILPTTATSTQRNNHNRGSSRATLAASSTFLDNTASERNVARLKTMRSFLESIWWLVEPLLYAFVVFEHGENLPFFGHRTETVFTFICDQALNIIDNIIPITIMFAPSVLIRLFVTYLSTFDSQLTNRQRLFVAMARIPKHSVHAVLAGIAISGDRKTRHHIFYDHVPFEISLWSALWCPIVTYIGPLLLKPARELLEGDNTPQPEGG